MSTQKDIVPPVILVEVVYLLVVERVQVIYVPTTLAIKASGSMKTKP